ncbi:MAG: class F sortase [Patescibacteria group bacterium]
MSKLNLFLIILLAGMLTFVKIEDASASDSNTSENVTTAIFPTPTPSPTPTPTPIPVGIPVTIQIPKLEVNASVEAVGTDFQGKMTMPEDWGKTAWYSGESGFRPSEKGNAVIAGHLDTIYGTRGQFYNLALLEIGDEVIVYDSLNLEHRFVVTDKQTYEYDKAPLDLIFGPSDESHLNLITCTGWYNPTLHNYDHRLVVYTKLVK